MPKVKPNEKEDDFIIRCIPEVIDDKTAEDGKQAYAICKSIYKQYKEKGEKK